MSSCPSSNVFIRWNGPALIVVADRFIADLFDEDIYNLLKNIIQEYNFDDKVTFIDSSKTPIFEWEVAILFSHL